MTIAPTTNAKPASDSEWISLLQAATRNVTTAQAAYDRSLAHRRRTAREAHTHGLTQREIAEALGAHYSRVSRMISD